jgi:hypothetical protein
MSSTHETTPWGAYKAWRRSPAVQLSMTPLCALAAYRATHSGLVALAAGVLALISYVMRRQWHESRERKRAAREHIAGLSRSN